MQSPILTSLLDTDAYKLHMQQAVFHHYHDVTVAAEFRCRNQEQLGQYVDEIKHQIHLMENLRLTDSELTYLQSLPYFKNDYLQWLKNWHYDSRLVQIENQDGQLFIRIEGKWRDVILWEVPLLAVISEIAHRDRTPTIGVSEAIAHLENKLVRFRNNTTEMDMADFHLMDFGTRRRYSFAVQKAVVAYLQANFPGFNSTSNYLLAYQLGLKPVGTQAHEWFQAHQRLVTHLSDCQQRALQVWLDEYPHDLGIALTDCITMDAFLRDFDVNLTNRYQGLRHDSGDPIEWGEKAIAHYQNLGIDPLTKLLVFSDSLNFDKAINIYRHFHNRVKLSFGLGGHLACDIPTTEKSNTQSLNIVIKLVECNGKSVAKLSDSPGKTISQDSQFIEELKRTFNVTNH